MTIYFQYRDPLIDVLDYVVELRQLLSTFTVLSELKRQVAEETIAIAENDLLLIQKVVGGISIRSESVMHGRSRKP
jgi:hypothetical protein